MRRHLRRPLNRIKREFRLRPMRGLNPFYSPWFVWRTSWEEYGYPTFMQGFREGMRSGGGHADWPTFRDDE